MIMNIHCWISLKYLISINYDNDYTYKINKEIYKNKQIYKDRCLGLKVVNKKNSDS